MPPHLRARPDRDYVYYIIDGRYQKSTGTDKRILAQARLEQYVRKEFGLAPVPTVGDFAKEWLGRLTERKSLTRDRFLDCRNHILPRFRNIRFSSITHSTLIAMRDEIVSSGLAMKTAQNIINSTFRAMYRDAAKEYPALKRNNPFEEIEWDDAESEVPDPFTADERDAIIASWRDNDFFYYPFIFTMFHTGMRPSEGTGLKKQLTDLTLGYTWICKSRNLGAEANTKTRESRRKITLDREVIEAMRLLPSWRMPETEHVFINKYANPLKFEKWVSAGRQFNWRICLKRLGIRYRKPYSTRHTFITEGLKISTAPADIVALARYCGTSVKMILENYCGAVTPSFIRPIYARNDPAVFSHRENLVAGPGFEPHSVSLTNNDNLSPTLESFKFRQRRTG